MYGECDNFHVINSAHSGAILDLHFSSPDSGGNSIYTASTDKTVGVFDVASGSRSWMLSRLEILIISGIIDNVFSIFASRIKRLKGHTSYVNSVHPARRGEPMIVSGSDDCMIKVWDQRKRNAAQSLNNMYQVTAVTFNDTTEQV